MKNSATLRAGEWVQVRNRREILQTLDKSGRLEALPFMPEMFEFCGKRFRVLKRTHKTCDPPNGLGARRMVRAVHLEDVRCNGSAHDGCQARCLIFWKEAWVKTVAGDPAPIAEDRKNTLACGGHLATSGGCAEQDVFAGTRDGSKEVSSNEPIFICQSTHLSYATQPWHWWDLRQYLEDYTSGNVRLSQILKVFFFFLYAQLASAGIGLGSILRWIYDTFQRLRGGTVYPYRIGKIPRGAKTPSARLDLKPGEMVKVRSYEEILATLDEVAHNRGMYFDAEMVPYCEGTYRVLDRISRIIDEKTGKMLHLKNDCIMLEGVVCLACYAKYRRFCSRRIYPYWREIWLERVESSLPRAERANTKGR
jgi:hypothetical protein